MVFTPYSFLCVTVFPLPLAFENIFFFLSFFRAKTKDFDEMLFETTNGMLL